MTETLSISDILGVDIRTRSRILELARQMQDSNRYVLDFSDVVFISRSFADELTSLIESSDSIIGVINETNEIHTLMTIVRNGRKKNSDRPRE